MSTTPNLDPRVTSSSQHESLTGVVERLTYHSSESGYSVARLKASGHKDLVTIVGSFPNIKLDKR
jgi:exodeoxyribonuclease V alpha subunit